MKTKLQKKEIIPFKKEDFPLHGSFHSTMSAKDFDESKLFLNKGEYDRDYVINFIKMILSMCDQHKTDMSANLAFTLKVSLEKLLKSILQETEPVNPDPMILHTCKRCGKQAVIHKNLDHLDLCECKNRLTHSKK